MTSTLDSPQSKVSPETQPQARPAQSGSGPHRVVVVGGGFAGLYATQHLGSSPVQVTLVDKRNFHLFQPLLYQVATGSVSPADIASPLRGVLRGNRNTSIRLDEAIDLDPDRQILICRQAEIPYDTLILATGASHSYFGNDHWQHVAPGLKTVEDALEMRRRIFAAFEAAEKEPEAERQRALLTFVIVGAGPTGVELAGAIAEIAHGAMRHDFRHIDTTQAQILLVEGMDRVLPPYPELLSDEARQSLERLGVTLRLKSLVTNITEDGVVLKSETGEAFIAARTVFWAAGVKASPLGKLLAERTGAPLDRVGRVIVDPDLTVPGYPNIFTIGDLSHFPHQGDRPLPGIGPVAIQEGQYAAKLIAKRLEGKTLSPFYYRDYGKLAVIGQNYAVVDLGVAKFSGFIAWLIWVFAHIYYLIEFDNKLVVMIQWGWNYFTRGRGARLIVGPASDWNQSGSPPSDGQ